MKTDFIPASIAYGFKFDAFKDMPIEMQRRVLTLLAQVSEKSYRRGLQHGSVLRDEIKRDLAEFRHTPGMNKSPYADSPYSVSSYRRIVEEYGLTLKELGFDYHLALGIDKEKAEKLRAKLAALRDREVGTFMSMADGETADRNGITGDRR